MKKVLYLTLIDFDNSNEIGVIKKIESQKKAFEKLDYLVDIQCYRGLNKIEEKINKIFFKRSLINNNYDLIYIRKPIITSSFIALLKKINKKQTKVIIEIPTYPYLTEKKGILKKIIYFHENLQVKKLKKYVDLITYYGTPTKKIWGIEALELQNGFECEGIKTLKSLSQDKLNLIALGNISVWHGYDRIIKSISNYSEIDKIVLHVVGEGNELSNLKKMTMDLNLDRSVIFHGKKIGEDLEKILEKCEIGIDSLGRHRSGNNYNSSLKSKEYIAYGLKIVKSHIDSSLENCKYVYNVEPNEGVIDLSALIKWHRDNDYKKEEIQDFARKNFSWVKQIKKIDRKIIDFS